MGTGSQGHRDWLGLASALTLVSAGPRSALGPASLSLPRQKTKVSIRKLVGSLRPLYSGTIDISSHTFIAEAQLTAGASDLLERIALVRAHCVARLRP